MSDKVRSCCDFLCSIRGFRAQQCIVLFASAILAFYGFVLCVTANDFLRKNSLLRDWVEAMIENMPRTSENHGLGTSAEEQAQMRENLQYFTRHVALFLYVVVAFGVMHLFFAVCGVCGAGTRRRFCLGCFGLGAPVFVAAYLLLTFAIGLAMFYVETTVGNNFEEYLESFFLKIFQKALSSHDPGRDPDADVVCRTNAQPA